MLTMVLRLQGWLSGPRPAAWVQARLKAFTSRWTRHDGLSDIIAHAGLVIVVLILLAVVLLYVLGPGKTALQGLLNSLTNLLQPPSIPST